ncbi:MAG: argininosuccinate lyase [Methanospirillum sp.]
MSADTLISPGAEYVGNGMVRDVVRGGRLEGERTEDVSWILSSAAADRFIGEADLLVDLAHVLMLGKQGIVEPEHVRTLLGGLLALRDEGLPASVFDPAYEDIHAGIEAHLTAMVGEEAGGRLHVGRSRNDEVATCLRLRLRDELLGLAGDVCELRRVLARTAAAQIETVMPGFTHFQPAQPTTLAHHLLAHAAVYERDTARLLDAFARTNRSPLGSAAFAGTGYPVDREWTAARLGFSGVLENSMDAVSGRDFALEALSAAAVLMAGASRLADELVLWSSPLVGFVVLDDAYSSTSSIMPQKKNPDTMELVRAKASTVTGALAASLGIVKGLPQAYNRDLQELSPQLWRGVEETRRSIRVLAGAVETARFRTERMAAEAAAGGSTATELADTLVREFGLPFRTAHHVVARAVRDGSLDLRGLEAAARTTAGTSLVERGLDQARIDRALDPLESVRVRTTTGGPAPDAVRVQLAAMASRLARDRAFVERERTRIGTAIDGLLAEAREAAA